MLFSVRQKFFIHFFTFIQEIPRVEMEVYADRAEQYVLMCTESIITHRSSPDRPEAGLP